MKIYTTNNTETDRVEILLDYQELKKLVNSLKKFEDEVSQFKIKYNGSTIISFSDYTWWITGFNPNYQNMNASSLTAIFTIRLNDPGMYNAFRASRPAGWTFALMQGFGIARFYF